MQKQFVRLIVKSKQTNGTTGSEYEIVVPLTEIAFIKGVHVVLKEATERLLKDVGTIKLAKPIPDDLVF